MSRKLKSTFGQGEKIELYILISNAFKLKREFKILKSIDKHGRGG